MSLEDKKALSRRALEMWASNDSDKPEDIFAANYVNHQEPAAAGGVKGLELTAWEEVVRQHHDAFSDSTVHILLQIAEGDLVATHWRFTVTSTGSYMGHAPTGKKVSWTGVQIDRLTNGKIAESWVSWDRFTLFEGLGLVE